jgi:GMP synthase (glutamine-hydrolysing)
VQPNVAPGPEIGWGPVTFPFPGGTDPIVAGLHDGAMMFHWHFDTFDLPKLPPAGGQAAGGAPAVGCLLLSSTSKCRNQAFRFKGRLLGFQYHFEMDRQGIQAMLVHARADVDKVLGPGGVDAIQRDTDRYYDDYERLGNRVIDNVLQYMKLI